VEEKLAELLAERKVFALATVVRTEGSTPGKIGFKMIVTEDGEKHGTIGGGPVERAVVEEAISCIRRREPKFVEYSLVEEVLGGVGQLCGGKIEIFVDVYGAGPSLLIVGGGHLALALASLAKGLGFRTVMVDPYAKEKSPAVDELYPSVEDASSRLRIDSNTFIVSLGDYYLDVPTLRVALGSDSRYVGIVGGRRRVGAAIREILKEGFDPALLEKVYAPVGLDIGSKTPEEIAVSITSEILKVMRGASGRHLREVKGVDISKLVGPA